MPESCEHTQAYRVLVDPPSTNMYMQLCDPGTRKPFSEGKIEGRQGSEIAMFMFRSKCLIEENGDVRPQEHLKKGEKVLVCVQIFDDKGIKVEKEKIVEVL